jgi:hypothetical protein
MGEIADFAVDVCAVQEAEMRAKERQVAKLYCIISSYLFADFLTALPDLHRQGRENAGSLVCFVLRRNDGLRFGGEAAIP